MSNEHIFEALTCSNCSRHMTTYIYLCYSGHSVCEKCRKTEICMTCKCDISTIRNVALETIGKIISFPCENQAFGCRYLIESSNMAAHSTTCDFRLYKCILSAACPWSGRKAYLEKHSLDCHDISVFIGNEITTYWNEEKPESSISLMLAFNELFYVHRKLKNGIMNWSVQYVGPSEDVILFCFHVEVFTDQFNDRQLNMADICHDDIKDIDEIIDTGFCAAVPLNILETFVNTQGVIMYKIKVLKT